MNHFRLLTFYGGLILSAVALFAQMSSSSTQARFHFKEPGPAVYQVDESTVPALFADAPLKWVRAWPENSRYPVEFGNRVVLQLKPGSDVEKFLQGRPVKLARTVAPDFFILQAPDAQAALEAAQQLADLPDVLISCPVQRRGQIKLHGAYAATPDDPYFFDQWNLENRAADGSSLGTDLDVRAAWPVTRGAGTVIAVSDDGVELSHPEFVFRAANDLHFNFTDDPNYGSTTNSLPMDVDDNHSTAVAGLALAEGNNHLGMSGVAPAAQLASWKIFTGANFNTSDEHMMDMFQYRSNMVSVQNHSWGNADFTQIAPTALEHIGISNAVAFGRGGRGVVMVRSAGNGRDSGFQSEDANDDGYANDPRVICVASVRRDGRAASYSNRGACLLVAAPGGDDDAAVFTTDRQGSSAGFNTGIYTNNFADYLFSTSIVGTSFSAPQVSGLAALVLSASPELTYRDVQQIMILSSRHFDLADPDLQTNGAGFRASHNVGFGVPDAGEAVALARLWPNRPPASAVTVSATNAQSIPDDGLRVMISNTDPLQTVPATLASIHASPGTGLHADAPTSALPVVDVGLATNTIMMDLAGKAALIQRGVSTFEQKINFAAQAGAAFAVIYDNANGTERFVMGGTDFVPIPAIMIGQNDGEALKAYLQTNNTARAQIQLNAVSYTFNVTNTLVCERVGLHIQSFHTRRGDLRITLLSPQGTRSVLQRDNLDDFPGPFDWTYYSTLHFGESSAGTWTVAVSDEEPLNTGSVQFVSLTITGVPIVDTDHDGLDDNWEMSHFGTLAFGPKDDPDGDGYNNFREQLMGTDPNAVDVPFRLDLSPWDTRLARLSWPGVTNLNYEVLTGTNAAAPLTLFTNVPGRFPETEWFTPYTNPVSQIFRVRTVSP